MGTSLPQMMLRWKCIALSLADERFKDALKEFLQTFIIKCRQTMIKVVEVEAISIKLPEDIIETIKEIEEMERIDRATAAIKLWSCIIFG